MDEDLVASPADAATDDGLDRGLLPAVALHRGAVPGELDRGRFFTIMCHWWLGRRPINFHRDERTRRRSA